MTTTGDTMTRSTNLSHSGLLLCALLAFLLSGCATSVRPVQENSERLAALQEIAASEDSGKLEGLDYNTLIAKGDSYGASGNDQLARLHYAMALKKMPTSIPALMGLGAVFQKNGAHGRALGLFSQVVEQNPNHAPALVAMGIIHREQGDLDRAEEFLGRALAAQPGDPVILSELGITYDRAGKEALAEPIFNQVAVLQPNSATAWSNLGFNALLQKKYDRAVEALQQALRLAPKDKRIINNLALALALRGDEERAFSLLQTSVGKTGAHNNLGYIFMINGEYDKAEKSFQQAMEENSRYYVRAKENLDQLKLLREYSNQ
jgi:Flp pilus assembly protein TadD